MIELPDIDSSELDVECPNDAGNHIITDDTYCT